MVKEQIRFSDLTWGCRIGIIFGYIFIIEWIIFFILALIDLS